MVNLAQLKESHSAGGGHIQGVHPAVFCNDLLRKAAQCGFITNVSYKVGIVRNVDNADPGSRLIKFLPDALADAARTAGMVTPTF